ncbi:MAG: LamG domain-containing protein, partial [Pseudolysinimonas sp.]
RGGWFKVALLVTLTLIFGSFGSAAWAYWLAGSTAGSNGASAATSVNAGATPTASAASTTITVSWAASTLATGQAVNGYQIKRYDANTLALQTILTACTGTVASTSCIESAVPQGAWKYSVTPVFATNWLGAESAKSATVFVDTTAPVNSLSLSNKTGGGSYLTGTKLYYQGSIAGSFTLTNAVTDSVSGPASSTSATLGGTSTGWTHTPSAVSTPVGGPYVSNSFSWSAATTSGPTELITGRDVMGNTAGTAVTFVKDTTVPALGTVTFPNAYQSSLSVSVSFTAGASDSQSGLNPAAYRLARSVAPLAGGVCGAYVTDTNFAIAPTSPLVDGTLASGNCYKYQFVTVDNVGNTRTTASANVVKVDATAPTNNIAVTIVSGAASITGTTVYYKGSAAGSFKLTNAVADAVSTPASSQTAALGGTTTKWTHTGSTVSTPSRGPFVSNTFTWTIGAVTSPTEAVTGRDAAGNTVVTNLTFVNDITAPTGGTVSYVNGPTGGTTVSVTFTDGTDAGSGIGTRLLQRASAALTNGVCGSYGSFATVFGGTNPTSPLADTVTYSNCYKYQYVVSDNVGNTTTATNANVATTSIYGAFYSFNENGGTSAADSSGHGYPGTLQPAAGWTTGRLGASALNLTGGNTSFVDIPTPVIDSSQSFTLGSWVKFNNLNGAQTIAAIDGNVRSPFFLQLNGGLLVFTQYAADSTGGASATVAGPAPTVGVWYYVAGVYDQSAGTIELFVNGVSRGTTASVTPWMATGHTTVGRAKWNSASTDYLNGAIDETRFYDRALSDAEIGGLIGTSAYFAFDAGSGTSAVDYSGNGYSATLEAAAGWTAGKVGASALNLNGSSTSWASYPGPVIDTSQSYTVGAWVKLNSTSGYQTFASIDGNNISPFYLQFDNGTFAMTQRGSDSTGSTLASKHSAASPVIGTWYHVVGVYDKAANTIELYVNGVSQGTSTAATAWVANGATTIGRAKFTVPTDYTNGALDEVRFYGRALTAGEVAALP